MASSGYMRLQADHYCYFKYFENSYITPLLYVNGMLIAGSSMQEIVNLKAQLPKKFSMKDLGPAKKILGMRISRERGRRLLKLSQVEYIENMLRRFNMVDAKPV